LLVFNSVYYYCPVYFVCFCYQGLFLCNLSLIWFRSLNSTISLPKACPLYGFCWFWSFEMFFVIWCLLYSCSRGDCKVTAFPVSSAKLLIQSLCLWLNVYFRPLFITSISSFCSECLFYCLARNNSSCARHT
jgi:hypothetical protein